MKLRTAIDWTTILARLEAAQADTLTYVEPGPEALREILDRRARELAVCREEQKDSSSTMDLLVFRAGAERFAVELKHARDVGALKRYTSLPGAPDELLGVFAHRGAVCSVIDLGRLLGCTTQLEIGSGYFIHLIGGSREIRVRVDELDQILNIAESELLAKAPQTVNAPQELIRGFTPDGIVVLRAEALLERAIEHESSRN